jgi:hypothetical protein
MSQYTVYCLSTGCARAVLPITTALASGFLFWSVVKDKPVASHTLPSVLSNLKVCASAMSGWAVDASGDLELKGVIKNLQETIPSKARRTMGVPVTAVVAACGRLQRVGTLPALQTRALMAGGMGALARGTELGGDAEGNRGMLWGDLELDHRGMSFQAAFCKIGKSSLGMRIRVFPHVPVQLAPACPTRCMADYKEALHRAGGGTAADDLVWCRLDARGLPTRDPMGVQAATKLVKAELLKEQIGDAILDAHWARHTGRRALQYDLKLGSEAADFMGDWSTPAAGKGKKSTGEARYTHLTVDETWEQAKSLIPPGFKPGCCRNAARDW